MKKVLSLLTAIVLISTMVSHSKTINNDLSVSDPETRAEKYIWERELDYVMEHTLL